MLNINQAIEIIKKNLPNGKIQAHIVYGGVFLFQVFRDDPFEEEMDPYFSVDQETGEFRDFSIFDDGNFDEIAQLFLLAKHIS